MNDDKTNGNGLAQHFPWIVVGVASLFLIWFAIPSSASKKYADFASLPAVDRGRIKPFDTFARTSLMIISGKQTYKDENKETHSAVKWLLDVMSGGPRLQNPVANNSKVFRIENLQVLAFLGLPPRPGFFRYSIAEIGEKIDDIIVERKRVTETLDPKRLTLYDHKIVELADHLKIYLDIAHWKAPYCVPPARGGHPDDWKPLLYGIQDRDTFAMYLGRILMAFGDGDQEQFNSIVERLQKDLNKDMPQTMEAARFEVFFNYFAPFYKCIELYVFVFIFACLAWLGRGEGVQILGKMIYGVVCFATLLSFTGTVLGGIWADQSWGRFWGWDPKENGALMIVIWNALILHARWAGMIKQRGLALLAIGGNIATAWSWFGVNMLGVGLHSYGFMSGALHWLIAFVVSQLLLIGLGAFLPIRSNPLNIRISGWAEALNRAAFWLMIMTLAIHTIALLGRMYLQGRPPVTNLYSSAVFIGWGGVILGLILEAVFKNGIGNVVGSVLGGLTLIIAHYLATSGDTLEMMQAVLDTNFWLATHVTCVTLGYTATFVAGFIGILFVVFNILIPNLRHLFSGKIA